MLQWASIEMFCACVVANAAVYFALIKDISRGHSKSSSQMTALAMRQSTTVHSIRSNDTWNEQEPPRKTTWNEAGSANKGMDLPSWKDAEDGLAPAASHLE